MGFFGNKSDGSSEDSVESVENVIEEDLSFIKMPSINVSTLNNLLKIKADIEGGGSLIIGGSFEGSVKIEETLFIEKGAIFNGKVKAKNVKIAGEFLGEVEAILVEVTSNSKFTGIINSNKSFLAGIINGIVNSKDSIEVLLSGDIKTKEFKSGNIKISGKVNGNIIASNLLEVTKDGSVSGEIVTKGIKTEQGGTIIGNIQTYDESLHGIDIGYSMEDINISNSSNIEKTDNQIDEVDIQKYSKKETKTPKRL